MLAGRCYCGATTFSATRPPQSIAYCHCSDCRRVTGAPVAVFAAFDEGCVTFVPQIGKEVTANPGVTRRFCGECGSPLSGSYDYLPGQIYVAVGLFDRADELIPDVHAHEGQRISWLHINDELPRFEASARTALNAGARSE